MLRPDVEGNWVLLKTRTRLPLTEMSSRAACPRLTTRLSRWHFAYLDPALSDQWLDDIWKQYPGLLT